MEPPPRRADELSGVDHAALGAATDQRLQRRRLPRRDAQDGLVVDSSSPRTRPALAPEPRVAATIAVCIVGSNMANALPWSSHYTSRRPHCAAVRGRLAAPLAARDPHAGRRSITSRPSSRNGDESTIEQPIGDRHPVVSSSVRRSGGTANSSPPMSGRQVPRTEASRDAVGDRDRRVARCVAERVVDDLEVIEVEEQDGRASPLRPRLPPSAPRPLRQQGPIGAARSARRGRSRGRAVPSGVRVG